MGIEARANTQNHTMPFLPAKYQQINLSAFDQIQLGLRVK